MVAPKSLYLTNSKRSLWHQLIPEALSSKALALKGIDFPSLVIKSTIVTGLICISISHFLKKIGLSLWWLPNHHI